MGDEYKPVAIQHVEKARAELMDLFMKREQLNVLIAKQQRRLAALAALVDESEQADKIMEMDLGGLSDAVRTAIKTAFPSGLTPREIRTRLIQLYFPVSEYKNFMASLHAVLNRLVEGKEIKVAIIDVHEGRNESVYRWIGRTVPLSSLSGSMSLEDWLAINEQEWKK